MKNFLLALSVFYHLFISAKFAKILKNFNQTSDFSLDNFKSLIQQDDGDYSPSEERLLRYLFRSYNPNIMPRVNGNESFKLYFGLALGQLINVYDKEQVMKTNVWLHMWWNDPYLQWGHLPEFDHIISIRVPYKQVWTPDIILFNNAHGKYEVSYKCNVVLYQQGGVLWIPPAIYKSSCKIDVKYFPFDQQVCEMIFGSWVYDSNELVFDYFENMHHADLNDYVPSGTWDLVEVPALIEYYNHTTTKKMKTLMVYKIKMRRKSLFYIVNIIIPTFLISFLSVCVFYLPTDDGEKITLSLGMLFALVVFFLLISKIIPPTSIVVPLISKYLLFTFIMNILSVLNTCITINFYYKRLKIEQLPNWIRLLVTDFLPRMLFMKKRKKNKNNNSLLIEKNFEKNCFKSISSEFRINKPNSPIIQTKLNSEFRTNYENNHEYFKNEYRKKFSSYHDLFLTSRDNDAHLNTKKINFENYSNSEEFHDKSDIKSKKKSNDLKNFNYYAKKWTSFENQQDLKKSQSTRTIYKTTYSLDNKKLTDRFLKVCKSVEYIANLIKVQAELDEIKEDWKYIAAVFDRFNLIVFLVVTFLGTYQFLFDAPYLFEESNQKNLIKTYSLNLLKP
ncbi:acetylcholine receptor subunit beta-like 1 [Brachionus plicatilis]|uniref:Acetylcholine receptor subunit beta-like 1 n=1 Tax=Brachionus plicatilis TaxID=10195 RepID=A0A3M7SDY6_BRAPC|nr:acetylcholine receptor subunit beta-like 1 [Brachionus plicatilis]